MTAEIRGTPPTSQPLDLRTVIDALPALVVSALPDGCVEFVNQGWGEYAGRSLDELTGSGWQAVIHPADISKFVKEWNAARAAGKALHNEGGPLAASEATASQSSSHRREILNPVLYSGAGGFEESAGAFARAAVLKDGAARHEDLGASAHDVRDCVVMDTAVYFNAKIEPARLADLRKELNLF
jgi:hypothetical protein